MFGSEILEIAIGLIFVFLLVSVICTAVREGIEAWLKTRAAYLEHGIRELLHDTASRGLARAMYEHPLIYSLYAGTYAPTSPGVERKTLARGGGLPSYIPKRNFAMALMDLAARGPAEGPVVSGPTAQALTPATIRANIGNLGNPAVQRVLLTALDEAGNDLEKVRTSLEAWYDSGMDRVSGWYKRSTQLVLFLTGLAVAIVLNVNAVTIADYLARNDTARRAIVARAETVSKQGTIPSDSAARKELDALALPIGWDRVEFSLPFKHVAPRLQALGFRPRHENVRVGRWWFDYVLSPLSGWLAVAFAATLGAPFWFDLLNKFMVIRSTVKPHEKSPEEASEDRQKPKPTPGAAGGEPSSTPPPPPPPPPDDGGTPPPGTPPAGSAAAGGAEPGGDGAAAGAADADEDAEGCEASSGYHTPDEELPPAEGGVA